MLDILGEIQQARGMSKLRYTFDPCDRHGLWRSADCGVVSHSRSKGQAAHEVVEAPLVGGDLGYRFPVSRTGSPKERRIKHPLPYGVEGVLIPVVEVADDLLLAEVQKLL